MFQGFERRGLRSADLLRSPAARIGMQYHNCSSVSLLGARWYLPISSGNPQTLCR
jgi:hypothetical protein